MQPICLAALYAETISYITRMQSPLEHSMSSSTKLNFATQFLGNILIYYKPRSFMACLRQISYQFTKLWCTSIPDTGSKWDLVTPIVKASLRHPGLTYGF